MDVRKDIINYRYFKNYKFNKKLIN